MDDSRDIEYLGHKEKKSKYPFLPVGCNKVFHNFLTVCCTYKKKITFHVLYFILAFNHFLNQSLVVYRDVFILFFIQSVSWALYSPHNLLVVLF